MRPCQSLSGAWCLPAMTLSTPSTWPSSRRWSRGWHCGECVCVCCEFFFVSITRHRHSSGHSGFLGLLFHSHRSHSSLEGFKVLCLNWWERCQQNMTPPQRVENKDRPRTAASSLSIEALHLIRKLLRESRANPHAGSFFTPPGWGTAWR